VALFFIALKDGDYMENTQGWDRYQTGLNYKDKINLFSTVDKSERFYSNRHWEGVKSNGLPTPILPVTKQIIDYKISAIMSDMITMQFSAEGIGDTEGDEQAKQYREAAAILSQYSKTLWENLKVDGMNEDGLLDAALSGDMVSYWYWNDKVDAGNGQMGGICGELIDNVNCFFGDPNEPLINDAYGPVQPYMLLSFRRQISDVKREAKENGVKEQDLKKITGDSETDKQAGDRSKIELDGAGDDGKCIVLLELWPENGTIWARKSTRNVIIRDKWNTMLHRYPIASMNWYKRKNSAHGEAEATALIPNQIMINQQAAMIALWIKLHGFPKVIYDQSSIPGGWTNDFSKALPVNGLNGSVANVAQYMQPAQISSAVTDFMKWFIEVTKQMAGANEAVLGQANPTNTSAIIVLQKATAVPLNSIKRRFYSYIEDIGLIWLDFWSTQYAMYPERNLEITQDNVKRVEPFDMRILQEMKLKLKIDVGPSTQWNEAAAVQTLDNMLQQQLITFIEYLKRIPNGLIPDRQGLIDDRESAEVAQQAQEKQFLYSLMADKLGQIMPMLSPEAQKELKMLQRNDPQGYEKQSRQLIQQSMQQPRPYAGNVEGGVNGGMPGMQSAANGGQ
jgi:hypothetical protein